MATEVVHFHNKKYSVVEIRNKRHKIRLRCTSLPFFLILRSRALTAAAPCRLTCGVAFRCCRGADVSSVWGLHFGLIGAARPAAAVAVFGPAWAGAAGSGLCEHHGAVIL